ncbi:uncharacterized protein GGS22DRAFT_137635 [Annulohypoxylon maeteangense]|uniref:uncharacterized protein n=1 Tax=Annulohypoxylon maeteangense TaxID=1927788 RepID=UPI002007B56B|nr:uncharacterized protein GGS22DRAFT_137635 [Annulohypoxylon maeteangense]KAI0885040.1 hypothetical protein GGS22DRAFT_137635 [Annulohypoxylon maeteangense]
MFSTRVLRQAAAHAERTPLIRFIGKRSIPEHVDHSPHPHPASPSGALPAGFGSGSNSNSHVSFSSYRDHAQQHGPLRKTIGAVDGIGAQSASRLGPIEPPKGVYFDRNELPERFRRVPLTAAEIEAIETGGAALFG